ncbi:MAG: FMN-binding protein, partial [Trebonia sp.]
RRRPVAAHLGLTHLAAPTTTSNPTPKATKATPKATSTTVTGSTVTVSEGFRTFGQVQVKMTLASGKITNLIATDYPNGDPRSREISQYSIPILAQEVLKAQGTKIDAVSGATYTSVAYAKSVQAALDSAKS